MKLSVIQLILCLVPIWLFGFNGLDEEVRAPRPDALSYPGSTPEIVSPFDTALLEQIQQCICQIKNILTSPSCSPIVIAQTGDVVISAPGFYCLANNVGNITITSSFVRLDMNSRIAESIVISGAAGNTIEHVIIENGFIYNIPQVLGNSIQIDWADDIIISNIDIDSDPTASASNQGIHIANSGNIFIRESSIYRAFKGILVDSVNALTIDQTSIVSSVDASLYVGAISDSSIITLANSFIDNSRSYGVDANGGNIYIANTQVLNSAADGVFVTSTPYVYLKDVFVDTCQQAFYWQGAIKNVEAYNCTALNYSRVGFAMWAGSAILRGCVAFSTVPATFPFPVNGFFAQQDANAVMYNCDTAHNDGSGFSFISIGSFTFYNCTSLNNNAKGFDINPALVRGKYIFYNCEASGNNDNGFSGLSTTCNFYSCDAIANTGNGFAVDEGNYVIAGCTASSNIGNGFIFSNSGFENINVIVQECVAITNGQYGFFNNIPSDATQRAAYTGNAAVGNVLGDFNAEQGKTPFFWKFAKNQAISIFDNAVIELLVN